MSTLVRKSGLVGGQNRWQTRGAFTLSDGSALVVVQDQNSASSAGADHGDKSNFEKIYVYHSVDRATWTLRATLTAPLVGGKITANLAHDNTVGIVYHTNTAVRYASVSPTWVASSWATVRAALTAPVNEAHWDLSFTSGNVPVLTALRSTTTGTTRLQLTAYVRRTSDSTWILTTLVAALEAGNTPKIAYSAISVAALIGGTATARPLAIAVAHGTGSTDRGVKVYTAMLAETTGVITAVTQRGAAVSVGDVPGATTAVASRDIALFQSDDLEYTLGIQHFEGAKRFGVMRATFDGTTWTETVPYISETSDERLVQYNMAMSYSSGRMLFLYANVNGHLLGYIAKYDGDADTFFIGKNRWFDDKERVESWSPVSNGGPYVEYPTHDTVFIHKIASNQQQFWHHYAQPTRAPIAVRPASGEIVQSALPVLRANADIDKKVAQSLIKMRWEFATDPTFTTNYFYYEQEDDKFQVVRDTDREGSTVPFNDVLPEEHGLTQGVWYTRVAHVDEFGVIGTYTNYNSFTVSHPPVAAALSPNNTYVMYDGFLDLAWDFTDPSPTDKQTAFRVIVTRSDTGAVVHDSGKVSSSVTTYAAPVASTLRDVPLSWVVILWDVDDVEGPPSVTANTMVVDAPSVAVTSPTEGQVIATATPHVLATVTVGGARWVTKYRVTITGTTNHSSGWVTGRLTTGQQIDYQPPPELLVNAGTYAIKVEVVDNLGVSSVPVTRNVTTAWTPPPSSSSLAVNVTPYNTEGQGWIAVTWSDSNRDTDFAGWVVYRRCNLLDTLTSAVLVTGAWERLAVVTQVGATQTYRDYTAPSGHQVQYRVEQSVIRFGDIVESTNSAVISTSPVADSYWLIEPDANNAFRLGIITSDSYTEEYEETDFLVIGRGRRYEQGERGGYRGTLGAQIRHTNGVSARQHKLRLEQIKQGKRTLYLRNPFGDLFRVAVGAMQIGRIAGVGLDEFVDISIPYMEVSDS